MLRLVALPRLMLGGLGLVLKGPGLVLVAFANFPFLGLVTLRRDPAVLGLLIEALLQPFGAPTRGI
jgi:hypothetical protein